MKYKRFATHIIVRIDRGEEIIDALQQVCRQEHITFGSIYGIGATDKAVVGAYQVSTKKYIEQTFTGEHEITTLMGNITTMNDDVYLHIHISLANNQQQQFGGHLSSAVVSATCEIIITIIEGAMTRTHNQCLQLNLLGI